MDKFDIRLIVCAAFAFNWLGFVSVTASAAEGELQFNRDIRPILSESCFACHGPDSAARKGDLRLDDRAAAMDRNAIVPRFDFEK